MAAEAWNFVCRLVAWHDLCHATRSVFTCMMMCCFVAMGGDVPRLAVFVDGDAEESRMLADMMQAELSKREGFEVVERSEIDRVLREQELGAAGFADDATRVQLGKIMKANGLVFVGLRSVRMVETTDGFLAGYFTHPQSDKLAHVCAVLCEGVAALAPKLSRNSELQTYVTILRFNTAIIGTNDAHPDESRFDAVMLARLTAALCAEPDVLVMERRRTGDLRDEAKLAGEHLQLKSGTLLIDGELASVLGVAMNEKPSVVLTVRIRDLSGRAIEPVIVRGFRLELDKLLEDAVFQTVDTVRRNLRTGSQDTLKAEVNALMDFGKTYFASWANEAAYALNTTNTRTRDELIERLFKGEKQKEFPFASYYGYARLEQIFREHGMSFQNYVIYHDYASTQLVRDMSVEWSHTKPELRALLQPVRQALTRALEEGYAAKMSPERKGLLLARMVTWVSAIAGTDRERTALRLKIFERVVSDPHVDDEARDIGLGYMLTQHHWKPTFFLEQTRSVDPVRKYYAHCRLMQLLDDVEDKRCHAGAAAREIHDLLQRRGSFGTYHIIYKINAVSPGSLQSTDHWLVFTMRQIYGILPEMKEPLVRQFFERTRELTVEKDIRALELLEPHITFAELPDSELLPWINEILKQKPSPDKYVPDMFTQLERYAATIRARAHPVVSETPENASLQREVLFTLNDFEREWKLPDMRWRYRPSNTNIDYDLSDLLPCRLLLDGDTLWMAFGGGVDRQNGTLMRSCGLVGVNVLTKQIQSGRFGWRECSDHRSGIQNYGLIFRPSQLGSRSKREVHTYPIMPLERLNDVVMVPHGDVGVGMFPIHASNSSDLRGVDWLDINSGLLDSRMRSFTRVGDICFLGLGERLVCMWTPPAKTVSVVFDTSQEVTFLNTPGAKKTIEQMWFDSNVEKLVVVYSSWRENAPGQYAGGKLSALGFTPKTGDLELLNAIPECPLIDSPSRTARKALEEDSDEFIIDIAPVDNTTFYALVGFGTRWRLEKVTKGK